MDSPGIGTLPESVLVSLILAGAYVTPKTRCQRWLAALYRIMCYSQFLIGSIGFVSAVIFKEGFVTSLKLAVPLLLMAQCFVKRGLLLRYGDSIRELASYLEKATFSSGDENFDENVRKRFRRKARALIIGVASVVAFDQIFSWVPNQHRSEVFYVHPWVADCWGENVALAIKVWYISIFITIWFFTLYGCTVACVVLIMGLETELKILAHNIARIPGCLEDLRQSYWDSKVAREQYWDRIREFVRVSVNQQHQILSNLHKLQPLVEHLFFWIYYTALVQLGNCIYLASTEPISIMYLAGFVMTTVLFLEIYSLCHLLDTLKQTFNSTADQVLYWCAQLPYSEDHHAQYVEMRTTLQIIAACSRGVVQFRCAGKSDISVAVFVEMVNGCYSVLMFLRDIV